MAKRLLLVAMIVAAVLVVAAPAMAFNGLRGDYTATAACATCHSGIAGIPSVYPDWAKTGHARAGAEGLANRLPYGSSCAGCHTSNYAPGKVIVNPTPTATTVLPTPSVATPAPVPTATTVSWGALNGAATEVQTVGSAASSESFVGCSACHYGANMQGGLAQYGTDPTDTAHAAPAANLANAAICGQCHSRYSYSVQTVAVAPVPYVKLDGTGTPITPNPAPTTLLQPQYPINGYKMLGAAPTFAPVALDTALNVPKPGWTPTPNPAATKAANLMTFWQVDVSTDPKVVKMQDTVWQYNGHDGSASQYPEWANEGHANALAALKPLMAFMDVTACLECHSADYRLAKEAGKTPPTPAQAQYGITCVGCHTPHKAGTATGAWSEEWQPQLRTDDAQTLCVECHNGEIPEGTQASPGAEVHHPMKEMMDGYGAIGVSSFPSVHKGKCVQCHMPPTSTSPTGANHTFKIIEPEVAAEALPNPVITTSPTPTMPYSACTTCHSRPNDTPAMWLQDTITQRQDWTKAKVAEIWAELDKAAAAMGYKASGSDTAAMVARDALVAIPQAKWMTFQRSFLESFTNVEFVQSEGSFGLHNWDYSREIVNTALMQAKVATTGVVVKTPWVIKFKVSRTSIRSGQSIKFSGSVKTKAGIAATGNVRIMRRVGGVWKVWKNARINSKGNYSATFTLTKTGRFWYRAAMPANSTNLAGNSKPSIQVVVNK